MISWIASTIFGVHYSLRNFRICQTVLRRRLRIEDADVTFLCNTVVFDGEELHASYYQSLLSQVRDMVDAL
ncbi:hypothetical protein BB544_04900 [Escherichia coli]|nr:hypothetical protein BB544_04900 [Escherichia coli]